MKTTKMKEQKLSKDKSGNSRGGPRLAGGKNKDSRLIKAQAMSESASK
jgi:hypothetical protein